MKNTVISALVAFVLLPAFVQAEEVATVPEGYVTLTIAAGTGTVAADSFISLPLLSATTGQGQLAGKITGLTSNTISNSQGGWTSGAFAISGSPFFVRITSGAAAGRLFLVSSNTGTQLTVDNLGFDLSALGITLNTDTYEIFPGDTLLSAFGAPSVSNPIVGGSSQNGLVDKVYLMESGAWVLYYYNTSASQWRRGALPVTQNTKVLYPGSPILYSRVGATALSYIFTGRVPNTAHVILVNNNGDSGVASFFPVDQTLSSFAFHSIPGWKKVGDAGITQATSDKVYLFESGAWVAYHYNDTASQWRRGSLPTSQNTKNIPAGTGILLQRTGISGTSALTVNMPYSLN